MNVAGDIFIPRVRFSNLLYYIRFCKHLMGVGCTVDVQYSHVYLCQVVPPDTRHKQHFALHQEYPKIHSP